MKGFMIYETPGWGDEENVVYTQEVNNASYTLKQVGSDPITCYFEGMVTEDPVTKATCNKDDEYDFEVGALISLMKKCGLEKSAKAYAEIFDDTAYGDALIERDKLKAKVDNLYDYNKDLIDEIDQKNHEIISLKALKLSNESLKKENKDLKKSITAKTVLNGKLLKDYNAAQSSYEIMAEKSADLMDEVKTLKEENEKLKKENYLWETSDELLRREIKIVRNALNTWKERYRDLNAANRDLVCENYKLKTDCEKLQKGYSAGLGRLVNINGVNYRECDEKGRVVWMTNQPESFSFEVNYIDTDALEALRGWRNEPVSKREQMWDDILKEGRTPVYVKREDVHDFLKECQVMGIKWATGKMPLETMPFHMSKGYDGIYFFVMTSLDISKSTSGTKEFRYIMCWWMTASDEEARNSIDYLPPMRWDLFKKGRLAVKVNYDNYKEFYEKCEAVIGKKPMSMVTGPFTVYHGKSGTFHIRPYDDKFLYTHKVVDWEDVR